PRTPGTQGVDCRAPRRSRRQSPAVLLHRIGYNRGARGSQMSAYQRPDENTLGTPIGKRGRPRPPQSSAAKALRRAGASGSSLGTGYLGIGLAIIAAAGSALLFANFLAKLSTYSDQLPIMFAWLLHAVAFAVVIITIIIVGE